MRRLIDECSSGVLRPYIPARIAFTDPDYAVYAQLLSDCVYYKYVGGEEWEIYETLLSKK
jgi:hypothetical protein